MNTKNLDLEKAIDYYLVFLQSMTTQRFSSKLIRFFRSNLLLVKFCKGEFFCLENSLEKKSGMLLEGTAKAYTLDVREEQQITKFFIPGDIIASENCMINAPAERSIEFVMDSIVLNLCNVDELCRSLAKGIFPELSVMMMNFYMTEMANVRKLSYMRSISNAKERLAYFFTYFGHYSEHFSGSDIANFIGIQRETFSRNKATVLRSLY